MRIVLLGTGTPNPSLKRMSSGYMVEVNDDVILFDFGPGAFHRLMETGMPLTRISHLFFSHLHYDHCLDYARLLLTRWDQGHGAIPELKVFGPSPIAGMTDKLFGPEGAFAQDIQARVNHPASVDTYVLRGGQLPRKPPCPQVTQFENEQSIEENGWSVQVIQVPHVQPYMGCFGYLLSCEDGTFAYSGDAGKSENFIQKIRNCDVLVHMCHQISGTAPNPEWTRGAAGHLEVAEIGSEANVNNLVVSHIPSQMDVPGVRERLVCEMAEIYKGNIIWGEDLMEIPITAPKPRKHTG